MKTEFIVYIALEPFWKRLRYSQAKIQAVAMDMGPAYIKAVKDNLSDVPIIFDHFHVIKLYNEKLTILRRDLQREAEPGEGKEVLKGTRWLLLKSSKKLDENQSEKEKLDEALSLNKPLAIAYYLKDELGQIWKQNTRKQADKLLWRWCKKAAVSGITIVFNFAKQLMKFSDEILAYYDFNKMSSGPMEGTNNKIKTLQKRAYGYRDMEFFKLKVMALHETRYANL